MATTAIAHATSRTFEADWNQWDGSDA
jgi:hypothetical protein